MNLAEQILDLARWAPSGDNSQPWRFEMVSPTHVVVHGFDERDHNVYDIGGRPSQISLGALLETIRIAASAHGQLARIERRPDVSDRFPVVDVRFEAAPLLAIDPLHAAVRDRCVQRRPLSTRALDAQAKASLESAVGPDHSIVWYEGWRRRLSMTWLSVRTAQVRLTIPEAYAVHRGMIRWNARHCEHGIPDRALGASALTLGSSQWAMRSWKRLAVMNRFFGGTLAPKLELDFIPGVRCAAHFAIVAKRNPTGIDDHLAAGAAVQRFWLTVTHLKLQMQPQYAPLIFGEYGRSGAMFTADPKARSLAQGVAKMMSDRFGDATPRVMFLGRVGHGPAPTSRSLRLPLDKLRWTGPDSLGTPEQVALRRR